MTKDNLDYKEEYRALKKKTEFSYISPY